MIKEIKITEEEKTVPKNFKLGLDRMTVITGENNTGKTNFIKALMGKNAEFYDEKGDKIKKPKFVFIPAENIRPSDNELRHSAVTSNLITNLAELFFDLGFEFNLDDKKGFNDIIDILKDKANKNLSSFSGHKKHELFINSNKESLDSKTIIKELINSITVNEYIDEENKETRKLENLGQGTQRLIVASTIKAYLDLLIDKKIYINKPVLILFEEPEIYLHPKLKRALNDSLEKISEQPNHQVIITTHDSYFVFPNFDEGSKNIVSFVKDKDGLTLPPDNKIIRGIEDELLFIFLYSKLEKIDKELIEKIEITGVKDRTYIDEDNKEWKNCSDLKYIRHQIHHSGSNDNTFRCGVSKKNEVPDGKNYYTEEELSEAIKKMSEILGSQKK